MHLLQHGHLAGHFAWVIRAHGGPLLVGTLATAVYTGVLWWIFHPFISQFHRPFRRPGRWRVYTPKR